VRRTRRKVAGLRWKHRPVSAYRARADAVHEIDDPNSDAGVELLSTLAPDIVVLGSARILAPRVLAIPRMGVLNAHPGLLPEYRGVDVIPWALHNGDPLGVSVHYVDAGIDTGDIVAQRRFDVRPGDTVASLTRRATLLGSQLMADAVRHLIDTGQLQAVAQPRDRGRTFRRMPPELRRQVDAQLASRAPS
jgi:methionyl-tRNA formyltransferase